MIRKTIIPGDSPSSARGLNLEAIASFEVSSENPAHPIENALRDDGTSWKAANTGSQTIRIVFDEPQAIARIYLEFDETEVSRTQEFSVRWRTTAGENWTELRRQQFNFSSGTTKEVERLDVNLADATAIELQIKPSLSGGGLASLTRIEIS